MPSVPIEEYQVGVVCALPIEMKATRAMLDEEHEQLIKRDTGDHNHYVLGQMHEHNVVIACLPAGVCGNVAAATVASNMLRTFKGLRFGLMVGIGGGIPNPNKGLDIRLGDIVVSQPDDTYGGVVQYDFGKSLEGGLFIRTGSLNKPPSFLLTAVSSLQSQQGIHASQIPMYLSEMHRKHPGLKDEGYVFPGIDQDHLHCTRCDQSRWWEILWWILPIWRCEVCENGKVLRRSRESGKPVVHYGTIASGSQLIRDPQVRDQLGQEYRALCVEMEAAGLMDDFPCIIIRGISDYANSHKNDVWQKYAAMVAAAYAKELLSVIRPTEVANAKCATEAMERYFLVSRDRVENFVGREEQLYKILSYFSTDPTTRPRCLILHALGGQGKSQIALEYCRRSRETYRGIFWVNASSEAMAVQEYDKIAVRLTGIPSMSPNDVETTTRRVKDQLEQWTERWLLVFDNYDEADKFTSIRQFIPYGGRGDVLFTSRSRDLERLGKLQEIPEMTEEEGVSLLLREHDRSLIQHFRATASLIITRLGGLALAIDQAAAYIKHKKIPLDRLGDFLTLFEAQQKKVLAYTPPKFWEYGTMQIHGEVDQNKAISAFTTWDMSFEQIGSGDVQRRTAVAQFLTLSAFLNPSQIDESLFRCYWEADVGRPEWTWIFRATDEELSDNEELSDEEELSDDEDRNILLEGGLSDTDASSHQREGTWSHERFWELIAESYDLSLLQNISQRDKDKEASFSLHPLIRDWLQLKENAEERRRYTAESKQVVLNSLKDYEFYLGKPEQKAILMLHTDVCLLNDARFSRPQDQLGRDITKCDDAEHFASFYQDQGQYKKSERIWRLIAATRSAGQGEEHPETLTSLNNLATVLSDQGKYEQAEEMHRRTLELKETALGKEHHSTLKSMGNLADLLSHRGKYEQAEEMHQQTLGLMETVLGKEHPDTLTSMGNLADSLSRQGKYEQAEEMHQRTLELMETVLGKEHPETLASLNNLATVLCDQGKYEQAEEMHQRTLQLSEMTLGREHPETLTSMNNLAGVLGEQGKHKQAEEMHRRTLELRERVLGKEHPDTLTSMNNLAGVLGDRGKHKQAEKMYRQKLKLMEKVLGKDDPSTLASMNNLAGVLSVQKKYEQAEKVYRRTLELMETVLGKEHPSTLMSKGNLANVYWNQQRWKEAEILELQALEIRSRTLGRKHPETLISMTNLACTWKSQGRHEEAEILLEEVERLKAEG